MMMVEGGLRGEERTLKKIVDPRLL